MKLKGNLVIFIVTGVIFCILYTFLGVKSLSSELFLEPQWTISLNSEEANIDLLESTSEDEIFHFRLKNTLGYFSQNGDLLFLKNFPFRATISSSSWATYAINNDEFDIKNRFEQSIAKITVDGFPFFQDNRYYVFPPGGNAVTEYDSAGQKKWSYEGFSPLIAFNSSKQGAILGSADGKIVCLNPEGKEISSFYPGGSSHEVILGAALAENKQLAASVSGINKQRFIVFQFSENQTKIIHHQYLPNNLKEQTFVKFNKAGTTVFFNNSQGLGVFDTKTFKLSQIEIKGKILAMEEIDGTNFTCILSKKPEGYTVSILEKDHNLLGSFSFAAQDAFILAGKNTLFIGRDDSISSVYLKRR
ncbi:MAG: hypothetical protein ACRC5H_09990 [Treponemataceae bacterium]